MWYNTVPFEEYGEKDMSDIYKVFACEVMRDEAEHLMRLVGTENRFECEWMEMGLHEKPEKLHAALVEKIAACEGRGYAAILLLFGLCSRATDGLTPPSDSRLVIPRVHDCIPLFLGSAKTFYREHAAEAGTFWFSRGWLHRSDGGTPEFSGLGAGVEGFNEDGKRKTVAEVRQEFIEKYGEENAEYLMETLMDSWKKNYTRAVYLEWEPNPLRADDVDYVRSYAEKNDWKFQTMPVDLRMLRTLLEGPWPEDEFVTVLPGQKLAATNDDWALCCQTY